MALQRDGTRRETSAAPSDKRVLLAEPRGFCAGVVRAIEMVERALALYGAPVYVRKQIVHNEHVVAALERKGALFVESEEEVPTGATCVFSAHGVAPSVRANASDRNLEVLDATCPLVSKVHQQARRVVRNGRALILIGHADHEETLGTRGEVPNDAYVVESVADVHELDLAPDTPVSYLTQTTLAINDTATIVEAIRERFTDLTGPSRDTICYASQNRQNGVMSLAAQCDIVLVVGSDNSSNSQRMVDVARETGAQSHLIPDVSALDERWLVGVNTIGVSSGASVPDALVDAFLDRLAELGFADIDVDLTSEEDVTFAVPKRLEAGA